MDTIILGAGWAELRRRGQRQVLRARAGAQLAVIALCVAWLAACGGGEAGADGPLSPTAIQKPPTPRHVDATQLAVLVAEGDALSEAAARHYQNARGLQDDQIVRVRLPDKVSDAISADDFGRLRAAINGQLKPNIQALLVTWQKPSRVSGTCSMGITAALALGYDARYCGGCGTTTASPYFNSHATQPFTELGLRPAMMLGAATEPEALALIQRGLAAESLMSRGTRAQGWLVRTTDPARSVRHGDFRYTAGLVLPGVQWNYVDNADGKASNIVKGTQDLMFYWTGLTHVPDAANNGWLPGAVADHLTSYGGVLPHGGGQMPVTDWLKAGATGSYGTVEEPCNYVDKFPSPNVMATHYARGDTLIEAYWKSVRWPGQGLFVGDPLARPWPRP